MAAVLVHASSARKQWQLHSANHSLRVVIYFFKGQSLSKQLSMYWVALISCPNSFISLPSNSHTTQCNSQLLNGLTCSATCNKGAIFSIANCPCEPNTQLLLINRVRANSFPRLYPSYSKLASSITTLVRRPLLSSASWARDQSLTPSLPSAKESVASIELAKEEGEDPPTVIIDMGAGRECRKATASACSSNCPNELEEKSWSAFPQCIQICLDRSRANHSQVLNITMPKEDKFRLHSGVSVRLGSKALEQAAARTFLFLLPFGHLCCVNAARGEVVRSVGCFSIGVLSRLARTVSLFLLLTVILGFKVILDLADFFKGGMARRGVSAREDVNGVGD